MSTLVSNLVQANGEIDTRSYISKPELSKTAKTPNENAPIGCLLTVQDVATILRVHPNRVYELASRKALPSVRVGRLLRFHLDTLQDWIRTGGTQGAETQVATVIPVRRG